MKLNHSDAYTILTDAFPRSSERGPVEACGCAEGIQARGVISALIGARPRGSALGLCAPDGGGDISALIGARPRGSVMTDTGSWPAKLISALIGARPRGSRAA